MSDEWGRDCRAIRNPASSAKVFEASMVTKNIEKFASLTRQHAEADLLVQGTYYDNESGKGCFIGCFAHGNNPQVLADEFGLPVMLTCIAERIFEALPKDEARTFFLSIPKAIGTDGKDLSRVGWIFLADTLRALPEQEGAVKKAVDDVIAGMDLLSAGKDWPDAARAADAAEAAAASWAVAWAAEAAENIRQRDAFLRLVSEAPVLSSIGGKA